MHSSWRTIFIAALATIAALAAFGASSAFAAANEIAYGCKLDICLLDPDNPAAVTNLTDNGSTSIDEKPVWSPDGKKLAFISNFGVGGNTKNLFVMEPEAPGQAINLAVQVTHFPNGEQLGEAAWSPDGSRIAFVVGNSESNDKVEVANSNGTTATPVVVAAHGVHPTWAPDSGKIAYSFGSQVYLENADGSGAATPLSGAAGKNPSWSPDGSRIAFDLPQTLSTVNLGIIGASGGGSPVNLPSGAQWTYSSWSQSGTQVGYLVSGGGEDTHWRVANADGSGDHALTESQQLAPGSPLSWSPDGSRVVYGGYLFAGGADTNQVYMENSNGSGSVTTLTGNEVYEPYPAWRPIPSVAPQQFIPAGGSTAPLPPTQKPKTVWITKRIPFTPGPDQSSIFIGSYGCGGPSCGVATQGSAKYVGPPSILFRSNLAAASRKPKYKPRTVVVGHGKTTIPGGKSGPIKLNLTKPGVKLLEHQGALTIAVTVTVTIPRQKKIVEHRQVRVFVKKAKHKHG